MVSDDFLKEIDQYSLSDLELIIDTQKELYSEEEMELLRQRVQKIKEDDAKEKKIWIEQHLPKEIICPKCDGPNPFENNHCSFCGYLLDKKKYYDLKYYPFEERMNAESKDEKDGRRKSSYTFQYIVSFLIPLVGFILGAILLGKDCDEEKSVGKACIVLGCISVLVNVLLIKTVF